MTVLIIYVHTPRIAQGRGAWKTVWESPGFQDILSDYTMIP